MRELKIIFAIFAVGLIMAVACKKAGNETNFDDCTQPTYDDDIKTILETHCTNITCHGADQQPVLTYFAAVKGAVDNGSMENQVISTRRMPKGTKLSQEEYDLINCWLSAGAPEKSQ
jgi:hypothetical protein